MSDQKSVQSIFFLLIIGFLIEHKSPKFPAVALSPVSMSVPGSPYMGGRWCW